MKKIGFIGLGNMGKGMSINLSKNNYEINGYDINDKVFDSLKLFNINKSNNIKDLVETSEVILTMLPDGKAVDIVWDEILNNISNEKILIDCSTIDVETSLKIQEKAKNKNLETLDAPVSGGVVGADDGTLTFMVGGKETTVNKVQNLFQCMGKKYIHCGSYGAGQSAKICNNLLLATTMIAVGETFELGKNLGLNLNKLFDVLSTSSGSCWAVNTYCPVEGVGPQSPSDKNFQGGFSTNLMLKDLGLAIEAIDKTNTKVDYARQTFNKYKKLIENNNGNLDFSYIVKNNN